MVRKIILILLVLTITLPGWSDLSTAVTLEGITIAAKQEDGEIGATAGTMATLDFLAQGNRNVKAELEINGFVGDRIFAGAPYGSLDLDPVLITIPRAYIKIRFPSLRMTLGKTAVSWGKGFMFNAGDVIFGGMDVQADLTQSVLRDSTITQILLTKYLGRLSYVDLIVLPVSSYDLSTAVPGSAAGSPMNVELWRGSAGSRLVFPIGNTSLEIGYLYKGDTNNDNQGEDISHNPYISFSSGFFGIGDFYLAASCSSVQNAGSDLFLESIKTSVGVSVSTKAGTDGNVNFRFETALTPFGEWEESDSPASPYGLYLYPEVSYSPKDNLSFQLRSIISPVDGSAIAMAGTSWNPFQGLTFNIFAAAMIGDENDSFGWDQANGLMLMLNVEYIFGN
jgi:hypothetical protein